MGFDAGVLGWYRGLEYFATWHWVRSTGRPFEQHTAEDLEVVVESRLAEA